MVQAELAIWYLTVRANQARSALRMAVYRKLLTLPSGVSKGGVVTVMTKDVSRIIHLAWTVRTLAASTSSSRGITMECDCADAHWLERPVDYCTQHRNGSFHFGLGCCTRRDFRGSAGAAELDGHVSIRQDIVCQWSQQLSSMVSPLLLLLCTGELAVTD